MMPKAHTSQPPRAAAARWPGYLAVPYALRVGCWLAVLAALLLALGGCATHTDIVMTDAEAQACKQAPEGCSVWTLGELRQLIAKVFRDGWSAGAKNAGKPI